VEAKLSEGEDQRSCQRLPKRCRGSSAATSVASSATVTRSGVGLIEASAAEAQAKAVSVGVSSMNRAWQHA
jgi:hypothetical protein